MIRFKPKTEADRDPPARDPAAAPRPEPAPQPAADTATKKPRKAKKAF